ncbi:MAG TPA: tetratricopeptide repeat protein [Acidobacteriota bacterium]
MWTDLFPALLVGLLLAAVSTALLVWAWRRSGRGANADPAVRALATGLSHLIAGEVDPAVEALSRAVAAGAAPFEAYLLLANLFRERGQLERAVRIHRGLLHRGDLSAEQRIQALYDLSLDYRRGGFLDRAAARLEQLLTLDPQHPGALRQLAKLHEATGNWTASLAIHQRLAGRDGSRQASNLASLLVEVAGESIAAQNLREAERQLARALQLVPELPAADRAMGQLWLARGQSEKALQLWERRLDAEPRSAYLLLEPYQLACLEQGQIDRLDRTFRRLMEHQGCSWFAAWKYHQFLRDRGQPEAAFEALLQALRDRPGAMPLHRSMGDFLAQHPLPPARLNQYFKLLTSIGETSPGPHVCRHCRYRTWELLPRCPHCQEWNSFEEARRG